MNAADPPALPRDDDASLGGNAANPTRDDGMTDDDDDDGSLRDNGGEAAVLVRVRVVAPRSLARSSPGSFPVSREVAEQTAVGEVFITSLIRSQLRLALVVASGFLLFLLGCGLLLAFAPDFSGITVATVPLPWLVLGLGIYPVIGLCAWLFVRSASRNEARYRDLVDEK